MREVVIIIVFAVCCSLAVFVMAHYKEGELEIQAAEAKMKTDLAGVCVSAIQAYSKELDKCRDDLITELQWKTEHVKTNVCKPLTGTGVKP